MKRIGIMTFHYAHNYGAMLQAYALCTYINKKDSCKTEIVDYRINQVWQSYSMDFSNLDILHRIFRTIVHRKRKKQATLFENFMSEYLKLSNKIEKDDLKKIQQLYDLIIVGSDQVWNTKIIGNDTSYFLDFCTNNEMKAGYAISIGTSYCTDEFKDAYSKYGVNFKYNSVREGKTSELIRDIFNRDIQVVTDPVFLLERKAWETLEKKPVGIDEHNKFMLFYSLNKNEDLIEYAKKIQERENCKVYSIHPLCVVRDKTFKNLRNVGPREFIWLIHNAVCVCTDSFHATAFSVIFRKKACILLKGELTGRICDLLDLLDCNYEDKEFDFSNQNLDFLNKRIEESQEYLELLTMKI